MAAEFNQYDAEVEMGDGSENGVAKNVSDRGDFVEEAVVSKQPERKTLHAKKISRRSPSKEEGIINGTVPLKVALQGSKNSRKSRTGRRGLPKKGGGGGKGTWGKPGSEIYVEEKPDSNDPNYDSDGQNVVVETIEPELTEDEFQKAVTGILAEYLEHGDTNEVAESLGELNIGHHVHHVPVVAVNMALDRRNTHREMISVLMSDLYGRVLEQDDFAKSFDILVNTLPDLKMDCPEAPVLVGMFIARAIADDCLPPKYVHSWKGKVECDVAREALEKADQLLSIKHGLVRLDDVWGVGGGIRPVKYLIKKIVLLLKEYLSSSDIEEATHCLKDLEVPHFHHELVYEGIMIVLENSGERAAHQMAKLFKSLCDSVVVNPDQMYQGFQRIFENLPDICLDVPNVYFLLERFANFCDELNCLPDRVMRELPGRGRKRFVSEGDGGRVKDSPGFRLPSGVRENPV